jgi:hypothetical protein
MRLAACLLLACVAGTVVHSAAAEVSDAPRKIRVLDVNKPKAPTSCSDNKNKHDCLHLGAQEGDCAWCAGDYMPASCLSAAAAKYIPEQVAKCKLPKKQSAAALQQDTDNKKKPEAPKSCGDNKDKHDCLHLGSKEGECAWCAGQYMTGSCLSTFAAKFIPDMVAKCKLPKSDGEAEMASSLSGSDDSYGPGGGGYGPGGGGYGPGGQGGCGDLKSKKKCLRGTEDEVCAWCQSDYMGDSCVSEQMAESYKYFAKCKIGKKHKKHGVEAS